MANPRGRLMGSRLLVIVEGKLVSLERHTATDRQPELLLENLGTTQIPPAGVGLNPADIDQDDLLDVIERAPGPDDTVRVVRRTLWRLPR